MQMNSMSVAGHVLVGIADIIGMREMDRLMLFQEVRVFTEADARVDCASASGLQRRLEAVFTPAAGRGILFRAGEATAVGLIRQHAEDLGFSSSEFRLQPWRKRLMFGLERLVERCNDWFESTITVDAQETFILWKVANCAWCCQRQEDGALCHFWSGFITGALGFASGGRFFQVTETSCAANGAPGCVFEIFRRPLE